jgi:hypothetical protein
MPADASEFFQKYFPLLAHGNRPRCLFPPMGRRAFGHWRNWRTKTSGMEWVVLPPGCGGLKRGMFQAGQASVV